MYLSDLQSKDIVSIKDGKRIGKIIDVQISNEGKIISLLIEAKKTFKSFIGNNGEANIKFEQITKIGEDVILVDI